MSVACSPSGHPPGSTMMPVAPSYDVIIRNDIAVRRDDHPGALAASDNLGLLPALAPAEWIGIGFRRTFGHRDRYDRRRNPGDKISHSWSLLRICGLP